MRKSFELLDWMKEHFKGGGVPSVLYKFTNGLKEQDGTVSVDAGNGISVNEHTKMLEVPIGEHLSYTSQGIDAKEGDTAQKGVVRLTDAIEAHADHATAATPAAVKEYVDANSSGSSYTFDSPLSESQGRVTVAKADEQNLGVVKLARTVSRGEHPNEAATPDGVAAYVDGKLAETTVNTDIGVDMKSGPAGRINALKSIYTAYAVGGTVLFACAFHMDELAGKNEALALFTFTGVSLSDMRCRAMSASYDHATECAVEVSGNVVAVSSTEKESPQIGLNYLTVLLPVKK